MLSSMNCAEGAVTVPVTARTEYVTRRHRWSALAAGAVLASGLIALTGLNYAGASGALTGSVVAVLITVGLAAVAYGRLGAPGRSSSPLTGTPFISATRLTGLSATSSHRWLR